MRLPVIRGTIERRILVNYRVDPAAISGTLPAPFRPQVVDGSAIAGICLIRLSRVRPPGVPGVLGVSSENAAHRIAVEWDQDGATRHGVYIPRRDTSSSLNRLVGGRVFPGLYHTARFDVRERDARYRIGMDSADGTAHVFVDAAEAAALPGGSIFPSMVEASAFFQRGSFGYSATNAVGVFDGLELRSLAWNVEPLAVTAVESSFFEDHRRFPPGSTEFDCALLMRNIPHEWRAHEPLCVGSEVLAA